MVSIQPIEHDGRVVALVLADRALIDHAQLPPGALPIVQAKCVYALEIEAQTLPGPYREPDATRFARDVVEQTARQLGSKRRSACIDARNRDRR
jgi:hypothetical protein